MSPERVNRETVRRRTERLRDEYDGVRVQEVSDELDEAEFSDFLAHCRDGYLGGGYAWVVREPDQAAELTESMPDEVDDGRRVLMILGRGGSRWGLPGGGREAGETFEETAVREVREETGVECEVTGLFLLRHVVVTASASDDEAHVLQAFFDAKYAGGHVAIQPGELNGAAWFDEPPASLYPENAFRAADFWEDYEPEGDPLDTQWA